MLYGAFLTGLLGSLHCLGMCGPIALLASGKAAPHVIAHRFLYNGGRIISYAFLGALMGFASGFINFGSYQGWLSIGLGVILIVLVFTFSSQLLHLPAPSFLSGLLAKLKVRMGRSLKGVSNVKSLVTGLLNGFLPCGLVYVALVGAIATGDPLEAALFMALFGLGTVPMLLAVTFAGGFVRQHFSFNITKIIPAFVFVLGALLILRGLNLDIPFVSPALLDEKTDASSITDCRVE